MPDEPEAARPAGADAPPRRAARRARRAERRSRPARASRTEHAGIAAQIDEGRALVEAALQRHRPGPYQVQAAIAALHDEAATAADTDWRADRGALPRPRRDRAVARRGAQPGGRRGDGVRAPGRTGDRRSRGRRAVRSSTTTCSTRRARTCCDGSAASASRRSPTGVHATSPGTTSSARSSTGGSERWRPRRISGSSLRGGSAPSGARPRRGPARVRSRGARSPPRPPR